MRLKQRKRAKPIADFLVQLGVAEWRAWRLALSGGGWWRMAGSPQATAGDGPVRPVVWEDGGREPPSYPIYWRGAAQTATMSCVGNDLGGTANI